jgi:phospholipid transport system substrate-binding protein
MRAKHFCLIGSAAALVLFLLPFQTLAASPKDSVETQVDKVLKAMSEPGFKEKPENVKIESIRGIVNEIFDYTELSRRTLGREWAKFNPAQQTEFVTLFSDLLEKTYADRLLSYSDEKVVFDQENILREGQAEVTSYVLTADGKKIPLDYRLVKKDAGWKVYDVIIEGISLVKNYRDQFRDILAKQTPEDVLKVLREKTTKG